MIVISRWSSAAFRGLERGYYFSVLFSSSCLPVCFELFHIMAFQLISFTWCKFERTAVFGNHCIESYGQLPKHISGFGNRKEFKHFASDSSVFLFLSLVVLFVSCKALWSLVVILNVL